MDTKILAATKFNTLPEYVKFWHELDQAQQAQANIRFSGVGMADHIYCLSLDYKVLARRRLERKGVSK